MNKNLNYFLFFAAYGFACGLVATMAVAWYQVLAFAIAQGCFAILSMGLYRALKE